MTTASFRKSSSRALLAALVVAGCVEQQPGVTGTTSIRVEVTAPADLGSEAMRLPDGDRNVSMTLTALDEQGQPDPTFAAEVDLYVHFLGTLSPDPNPPAPELVEPLATATMTAGTGTITLPLDFAYGRTLVWVEDVRRDDATFATGLSPDIWFRDPFLDDVSRPRDEMALDALQTSSLEGKQVKVSGSRFGAGGRMVITAVYAQGYTVSDVETAGGATPPYGHMFVFTFGRPRAEDGTELEVGHIVKDVSGGVSEFNGYTEFGFPQTNLVDGTAIPSAVPPPAVLDADWLLSAGGVDGMINLERLEGALVAVDGATVCPSDDDFTMFNQWKLDVGHGCGNNSYSVITAGQVAGFDPFLYEGQVLPRVVGTLKAVNLSFNVWILLPRQLSDLTTP